MNTTPTKKRKTPSDGVVVTTAPSSVVAAASSSSPPKTTWRCDVCHVALFDDYKTAIAHEQTCSGASTATTAASSAAAEKKSKTTPAPIQVASATNKTKTELKAEALAKAKAWHDGRQCINGNNDNKTVSPARPSGSGGGSNVAAVSTTVAPKPKPRQLAWRTEEDYKAWQERQKNKAAMSPNGGGSNVATLSTTEAPIVSRPMPPSSKPKSTTTASSIPAYNSDGTHNTIAAATYIDVPPGKLGLVLQLNNGRGAQIISMSPTSVLHKTPVRVGDFITKVDGTPVVAVVDVTVGENRIRRLEIVRMIPPQGSTPQTTQTPLAMTQPSMMPKTMTTTTAPTKVTTMMKKGWETMKVWELKEACKERSLAVYGKKDELIKRLHDNGFDRNKQVVKRLQDNSIGKSKVVNNVSRTNPHLLKGARPLPTRRVNGTEKSSSPIVQVSDTIVKRNLRSAILLVNLLLPITTVFLSVMIPLRPLHGILLVAAMLLPTITVITSAMTIHREESKMEGVTLPTLRVFLTHPDGFHMGFAPAFFGFFAYFGALAALEEETNGRIVPKLPTKDGRLGACRLHSVSGASAGAMAAVMLAAGIQPREAAEFVSKFTWRMIADPPGFCAFVKGNIFEETMRKFIAEHNAISRSALIGSRPHPTGLETSMIPVAVSSFDLLRMRGTLLIEGCMARAARASAGFPGLFQPVAWSDGCRLLIDGGITDGLGLNGLGVIDSKSRLLSGSRSKRVINFVVGEQRPRGIGKLPKGVNADCLVSIVLIGSPMCGPWAMQNGPRAFESVRLAMIAALDKPMCRGEGANHYVIRVDASQWLD